MKAISSTKEKGLFCDAYLAVRLPKIGLMHKKLIESRRGCEAIDVCNDTVTNICSICSNPAAIDRTVASVMVDSKCLRIIKFSVFSHYEGFSILLMKLPLLC